MKKKNLALLLAGGQGSRLGVLTKTLAKPAVLFGGKYRIIDFSLSNCINSGIDTVGILEQYLPLKLNNHIGIGKPWDMDRMNGGVTILAPYQSEETGDWFQGTADAVYQNIHYIDRVDPENVIILSGDHIYKMNYSLMIDFHEQKNADVTISVIDVPLSEAQRFGILNTDDDSKVIDFEEKPKHPKSTLASMGVYVFKWSVLKEYLLLDHEDTTTVHDFGKNILPRILKDNKDLYAYSFNGYWKDVGTITSYWEANIELTHRVPKLSLYDHNWRIYTPNPVKPAHYISPEGSVKTSIIAEGCMIYGEVKDSVLFPGVTVSKGTRIENSIIMSNTNIGENTKISKTIVAEKCSIGNNVKIGIGESKPNCVKPEIYTDDITVVGEAAIIPDNVSIGKNVLIDIGTDADDYHSNNIRSGSIISKAGECDE